MSKLYSWLQSEDNGKAIGELYWNEQFKKFKLISEKQKCDDWVLTIVSQDDLLSNIKKNVEIEFLDSSPFSYIHAQWNPNTNRIEIYNDWITAYEKFMSNEQALDVHIYHELYHLYEENNKLWYDSYKYRQRNFMSEYCALEISRKLSNLEFATVVYDLCVQTENEQEAISELERRLNNETTNR